MYNIFSLGLSLVVVTLHVFVILIDLQVLSVIYMFYGHHWRRLTIYVFQIITHDSLTKAASTFPATHKNYVLWKCFNKSPRILINCCFTSIGVDTKNVESNCIPNKKPCKSDGSLGYCCSTYCHSEPGWVTGKCRVK